MSPQMIVLRRMIRRGYYWEHLRVLGGYASDDALKQAIRDLATEIRKCR